MLVRFRRQWDSTAGIPAFALLFALRAPALRHRAVLWNLLKTQRREALYWSDCVGSGSATCQKMLALWFRVSGVLHREQRAQVAQRRRSSLCGGACRKPDKPGGLTSVDRPMGVLGHRFTLCCRCLLWPGAESETGRLHCRLGRDLRARSGFYGANELSVTKSRHWCRGTPSRASQRYRSLGGIEFHKTGCI